MKICNNWEYSIKFECSTVTVNFWKQLCRVKTSNRPVQAPKHPDVQSPGAKNSSIQTSKQTSKVKASKCPESKHSESKHPGIQIRHIQSPSVQSPGIQTMRPESSFSGMPNTVAKKCKKILERNLNFKI